jgi:hypothetical protein
MVDIRGDGYYAVITIRDQSGKQQVAIAIRGSEFEKAALSCRRPAPQLDVP